MIKSAEPNIGKEEIAAVMRALKENQLSGRAPIVHKFEDAFARYCGARYGIATNSGSSALLLSLIGLDFPRGSEVILPVFGYIAPANAVVQAGLTPVFVDVEQDTGNIDPDKIRKKITPRTKAILCIHTYGHPCRMREIRALAKRRHITVIEDAAEAHGAEYRGRKVGALGTVGCFSFFANKVITTGEGGMVVTNDRLLAERIHKLSDQAFFEVPPLRYWHSEFGYKMTMGALQAAVGLAQLKKIKKFIRIKRRIAKFYDRRLGEIMKKYNIAMRLPPEKAYAKNTFWMYGITLSNERERNTLLAYLNRRGIEARNFFPAIHWQPKFKHAGYYPHAEALARTGLYLPSGTTLTRNGLERIAGAIEEFYKNLRNG